MLAHNTRKLLRRLNRRSVYKLLYDMGTLRFIRLDNMKSVGLNNSPFFILIKNRQFYRNGKLFVDQDNYIDLPVGRMYNLECSGINVGLLFEFPHFDIRILDNMVSVIRPNYEPLEIESSEVVIRNKTVAVFADSDNVLSIVVNKPLYINIKT